MNRILIGVFAVLLLTGSSVILLSDTYGISYIDVEYDFDGSEDEDESYYSGFEPVSSDPTQEKVDTARSVLNSNSWSYEGLSSNGEFEKLRFVNENNTADVVIDSEGNLIKLTVDRGADEIDELRISERTSVIQARRQLPEGDWRLESNLVVQDLYHVRFSDGNKTAYILLDGSSSKLVEKQINFEENQFSED